MEKLVTELNGFDNIFYKIQNEPWSDDPQKVMRLLKTLDPEPEKGFYELKISGFGEMVALKIVR